MTIVNGPTPTLPTGGGGLRIGDGDPTEPFLVQQAAPAAYTGTATTLLAADITGGLVTSSNASAQAVTLPLATDLDTAVPNARTGDSFVFSLIELAAGTATVTTNTGWTLVGSMAVAQNVSGRFLARKTGTGTWTLYRLS